MSLKNVVFGPPIATGSLAIVHAARIKTPEEHENNNELAIDKTSDLSEIPLSLKIAARVEIHFQLNQYLRYSDQFIYPVEYSSSNLPHLIDLIKPDTSNL